MKERVPHPFQLRSLLPIRLLIRSSVFVLVGTLAFSGVLDRSDILALSGSANWPRLDLADHSVFFRRT
jgi:hypothetical protein